MPVVYVSKRCYGAQYLSKHTVLGTAKRDVNVSGKNTKDIGQSVIISVLKPFSHWANFFVAKENMNSAN